MERARGLCERCGREAEQVHHLTYARKYNERLDDLLAICGRCHDAIHNPPKPRTERYQVQTGGTSPFERELICLMVLAPQVACIALERVQPSWLESDEAREILAVYQELEFSGEPLDHATARAAMPKGLQAEYDRLVEFAQETQHLIRDSAIERLSVLVARARERDERAQIEQLAESIPALGDEAQLVALESLIEKNKKLRRGGDGH